MRDDTDIIQVDLRLVGSLSLDKERMEQDPNWRTIAAGFHLPDQLALAVVRYMEHYVRVERFLRDCPSTNGPGDLRILEMEVEYGRTAGNTADSNTGG